VNTTQIEGNGGRSALLRRAALPIAAAVAVGSLLGGSGAGAAPLDDCVEELYVSPSGDDANAGTSIAQAWETLDRVVLHAYEPGAFGPGTCVFFEGRNVFPVGPTGGLFLDDARAGDAQVPVVISSFGDGRATLDVGDGDGIFVYNTAGVEIRDINVTGTGYVAGPPVSGNQGTGVFFYTDTAGGVSFEGVTIQNVDVSGFVNGIMIGGENRSGFSSVLVEDVRVFDNADAGFQTFGDASVADTDYAHSDVTVRRVESFDNLGLPGKGNNSGNGIIFGDVDGGVIEYSIAHGNGALNDHPGGGPIGIWAYESNDVVIQYNVSFNNDTGTIDGGGFDLDGGVTNSTMQYNYSFNNAGAGYLVFQYEGARPLENNVVRYNISHNDGRKGGQYGGIVLGSLDTPALNTEIYGNSIYLSPNSSGLTPAAIRVWDGTDGAFFYNNSVHVAEGLPLVSVETNTTTEFVGNNYFSEHSEALFLVGGSNFSDADATSFASIEAWRDATGAEIWDGSATGSQSTPGYAGDPSASIGDPEVFAITADSALNGRGIDLLELGLDPGPRDFFGVDVPRAGLFSIGASQGPPPAAIVESPSVDGDDTEQALPPVDERELAASGAAELTWLWLIASSFLALGAVVAVVRMTTSSSRSGPTT